MQHRKPLYYSLIDPASRDSMFNNIDDSKPYDSEWEIPEAPADLKSPSLFPFSPAAVSRRWMEVMSLSPVFWTRIVILLDSPNCVNLARSQFLWSGSLPITVLVTTKNADALPDKEQEIAGQVIGTISSHLARCESLEYDVTYSSSLPRLATDFPYIAPRLSELKLESSIFRPLRRFKGGRVPPRFPFAAVRDLVIDGWTFVDMCSTSEWWFKAFVANLQSLRIHDYHPDPGEDEEDMLNDVFPLLVNSGGPLYFDNVNFHSTSVFNEDVTFLILSLSRLSSLLLSNILRNVLLVDHLIINRCSLSDVSALPCYELTLYNIDSSTLSEELIKLLPTWQGRELYFKGCPGLNDSVFEMLGDLDNCPCLEGISIDDCHGLSLDALKTMVEKRYDGEDSDDEIIELAIRFGPNMPPVSQALKDSVESTINVRLVESDDFDWWGKLSTTSAI
ncbi:hypothetical protein C0991_011978 [Blastosporella zonata]|nr:hypothetical protein C0991_011978 [Blastosporella zonata]